MYLTGKIVQKVDKNSYKSKRNNHCKIKFILTGIKICSSEKDLRFLNKLLLKSQRPYLREEEVILWELVRISKINQIL